jgi:predicted DNA-binding transcriptional regulator AlpA
MKHIKATDEVKASIVEMHYAGNLQIEIAKFLGISRKTVYRVLIEKGLLPPKQRLEPDAVAMIAIAYKHGISTPAKLDEILNKPTLTMNNLKAWLSQMSNQQLADLFYNTALVKIAQMVKKEQSNA